MAVRVAINGFGRIGRLAFRQFMSRPQFEVVSINDLTDVDTLAHLLKYDSIHGAYPGEVSVVNGNLMVQGKEIQITAERNPLNLPWGKQSIDIVVESTGVFADAEKASTPVGESIMGSICFAPFADDVIMFCWAVK